jgi:NAD(P)-dependent dehydrogenase (short-subunit alcohol dehydrogenase family)
LRAQKSLDGWVIVVTGASSGNGKAILLALASKGARLILAARRVRLLEAVAREAEDRGAEALDAPCDVTDPEQVHRVAEAAVERWGRIDGWVNCAGVIVWSLFEDTTTEEFRRTLA